jgi:hypothetical protein
VTLVNVTAIDCNQCHYRLYVLPETEEALRRSKRSFFCINGHSMSFSGPWQAEIDRDEWKRKAEQAEFAARRARNEADAVIREAKLTKNACRACKRRFETHEALTRHIRRIHQNGPKRLPETAGPST